jgi:uncharacterized protein DUF4326
MPGELFDPLLPLSVGHTLTPVSLQLAPELTAQQWHNVGAVLQKVDEARQWWLGDWWNAGVKWGEGQRVCEELGLDYGSVRNAGRVAQAFTLSRRRDNLSFRHHTDVCSLDDPAVQDRFLLWCEETIETTGKPRSTRELREAIRSYLDSQGWTDFERERRRWVEELGYPTLANHHTDVHLLQWAKMTGRHVYIGRGSKWGNPFEIGKDGDREFVIDSYCLHYLPRKPSLLDALPELDGKVLECYCVPEPCHGEVLIETLRREAWELLDQQRKDSACA